MSNQLDITCTNLANDILNKVSQSPTKPFFVFIGGGRSTGKSTVASAIQKLLKNSIVISEDYYIFSSEELRKININIEDPKAKNIDMLCQHIELLKKGQVIKIPVEGPMANVPGNIFIDPYRFPIIIIEGTCVFEEKYDGVRDYSIFMECDEELMKKRFVDRCLLNPERNPFIDDINFPIYHDEKSLIDYFSTYILPFHRNHFINGSKKSGQIIKNEKSHHEKLVKIIFPNGRTFFMKPPTPEDITVRKGAVSKADYGDLFFGGIFQQQESISQKEFILKYKYYFNEVILSDESETLSQIMNLFFDHPDAINFLKKSSADMPFLWKSQPDIRRGFKWADSAIKFAIEKSSPDKPAEKFKQTVELISDLIKIKTENNELYIFDNMDIPSFMRLINVAASIVCGYPINYAMQEDTSLMVRNEANLRACKKLGLVKPINKDDRNKLKQLLKLAVYAGITFPSEDSMKNGNFSDAEKEISRTLKVATEGNLGIDHSDQLIEILNNAHEVSIILDDNGECVPDLLFIQNITRLNPDCKYNFLINKNQIGINLRTETLLSILEYPEFSELKKAFKRGVCKIIEEESSSESLSYELLSKDGRLAIDKSDLSYIKGQLFFETFSNKSKYTAYAFVPSSSTAIIYSGKIRGGVVLVCKKNTTRIEVDENGIVTKKLA